MKRTAIISLVLLALFIGLVAAYLVAIRPWQSKILAQGVSPEGREYCVVQTFKDLVEPYQVSFYVRDPEGVWRWHYLEHEDSGWKSAEVIFSEGSSQIQRNGTSFKEIPLPNDQVDLGKIQAGYRDYYCDRGYSVEDVFAFHNQKYN